MKRKRINQNISEILRICFILLAVVVVLFPYVWVILSSFKMPADLNSPTKLLFLPVLENWINVLSGDIPKNFLISLIIGLVTVSISLVVGAPAAYSISQFRTGGRPTSFGILVAQMIPPAVMVIPLFFIGFHLKINGTMISVIIGHLIFVLPVVTWFLISFFAEVPKELEESARIDGCSKFMAFRKIVLPQVLPGIGAAGIFGFILSWNDMFFALILGGEGTKTLPLAIVGYNTFRGVQLGEMSVAILTAVIPTLIFSFFVQKRLIKGIGGGGVKG